MELRLVIRFFYKGNLHALWKEIRQNFCSISTIRVMGTVPRVLVRFCSYKLEFYHERVSDSQKARIKYVVTVSLPMMAGEGDGWREQVQKIQILSYGTNLPKNIICHDPLFLRKYVGYKVQRC
jgi:hypothetical protein